MDIAMNVVYKQWKKIKKKLKFKRQSKEKQIIFH